MTGRGGRSFAEDRRLKALAGSLKSLEAVAKKLGRTPKAVAKPAMRLGVSLKSETGLKVKPNESCFALGLHDGDRRHSDACIRGS
jgi:hypothetical protein